jgi:Sugar (and other) transporter
MALGLFTVYESPRWLASQGRSGEAHTNLAYLRKRTPNSEQVRQELAEIEAAIAEEREARSNLGLRQAILERGNSVRFLIAFFIFFLQQWCGQNSVNYYAPQIFTSVSTFPDFLSPNHDPARSATQVQQILSSRPASMA